MENVKGLSSAAFLKVLTEVQRQGTPFVFPSAKILTKLWKPFDQVSLGQCKLNSVSLSVLMALTRPKKNIFL